MKISVVPKGTHPPQVKAVHVFRFEQINMICIEVHTDWKATWGAILMHMEGTSYDTKCVHIPKRHASSAVEVLISAETELEKKQLTGRDLPTPSADGFYLLVIPQELSVSFPPSQEITSWQAKL